MNSKTGLTIAATVGAIALVVGFLWLRPAPPAEPEPVAPEASEPAAPVEEPTSSPLIVEPEDGPGYDLTGDALERALPELVELARAGDEDAFDAIIDGLHDVGNQARDRSVLALGAVGDPAIIGDLEFLLGDPDPDIRETLVKTLVKLGGDEAKPLLVALVLDDDPDVAEDAMQALVSANYEEAIPQIREVLAEGDPHSSILAARALRKLGDDASADAALRDVAEGLLSERAMERRDTIAKIKTIGGKAALEYLEPLLEDPDPAIVREASLAIRSISDSL